MSLLTTKEKCETGGKKMKVGDLVRIKNDPEVIQVHCRHDGSGSITPEHVGLVMEWNPVCKSRPVNFAGQKGDGWVLWSGRIDWDIEYEEDLEIVSEAK